MTASIEGRVARMGETIAFMEAALFDGGSARLVPVGKLPA